MRAIRYVALNIALISGLQAQLGHNETLDWKQQAEYYKLAARMTWAQLQVALQDLEVREAMAKRTALYQESIERLRDMEAFQSAVLKSPDCEIIQERAQVKCQGEADGKESQEQQQEVRPQGHPGHPPGAGVAAQPFPAWRFRHQESQTKGEDRGEEDGTPDEPR